MGDTIVEEGNVVQQEPVVESRSEAMIDKSAYDKLQAQIESLTAGFDGGKSRSEIDSQKLEKVRTALIGDDGSTSKQKFVDAFVENPEAVLEERNKKAINEAVSPLLKKLEDRDLSDADTRAMNYLKSTDSDYVNVVANMKTYVGKEFTEHEKSKDRFEILYSLTKARMERENGKKTATTNAIKEAKDLTNTKAVSEQPRGTTITEADSPNAGFYKNVADAKAEFRSDDVLDSWADIFFDESNPQGFWTKHELD
jgi:hypothetical protein